MRYTRTLFSFLILFHSQKRFTIPIWVLDISTTFSVFRHSSLIPHYRVGGKMLSFICSFIHVTESTSSCLEGYLTRIPVWGFLFDLFTALGHSPSILCHGGSSEDKRNTYPTIKIFLIGTAIQETLTACMDS